MKKAKKMTAVTLTAALLLSSIPGNVFAGGRDEEKANSKIQAEFFVSPDGDDQIWTKRWNLMRRIPVPTVIRWSIAIWTDLEALS